jgi:CRISPR-associated exonuclease Cas4
VLFGLATVVAYVVVAGVVNAQPPTRPYAGWVAVLQPPGDGPEQVELRVEALEPGALGEHPALRYTILACGNRPFEGVLLIGGQARLDHAKALGQRVPVRGGILHYPSTRRTVTVPYGADEARRAAADIDAVLRTVTLQAAPPRLARSRCRGCSYLDYCWVE